MSHTEATQKSNKNESKREHRAPAIRESKRSEKKHRQEKQDNHHGNQLKDQNNDDDDQEHDMSMSSSSKSHGRSSHSSVSASTASNPNQIKERRRDERQEHGKRDQVLTRSQIRTHYDARKFVVGIINEKDPCSALRKLSGDEGIERLDELLNMKIEIKNAERTGHISLHRTVIPLFATLSHSDYTKQTMRTSLRKVYNKLFDNPRFFFDVLDKLDKLCETGKWIDPSYSERQRQQDQPNLAPDITSWDDVLFPTLSIVDNFYSISGNKVMGHLIYCIDHLEKLCQSVSEKFKLEDRTLEVLDNLRRRKQTSNPAKTVKEYKENTIKQLIEKKMDNLFMAYQAPDEDNIDNNNDGNHEEQSIITDADSDYSYELNQNNKFSLIPASRDIDKLLKSDYLPKRTQQTFQSREKLQKYFFSLIQHDALKQFSALLTVAGKENLFALDKSGQLALGASQRIYLADPSGKRDSKNFVNLNIYGPGYLVQTYPSLNEGKICFLCVSRQPFGVKKDSKQKFTKKLSVEYWKKQSRAFQPDSLVAIVWKTGKNPTRVLLTKVILCIRKQEKAKDLHPAVEVDPNDPSLFQFAVVCYNDHDTFELLSILRHEKTSVIFCQIKGHFFPANEAILHAMADENFLTSQGGAEIERGILGDRAARMSNPCKEKSITVNLEDIWGLNQGKAPNELKEISINDMKTSDLFGILHPFAEKQRLIVDTTQARGIAAALTQSISLIQGPPGTGKTYVGIQIARILLRNQSRRSTSSAPRVIYADHPQESYCNGPILCICYTNHALDAFLEGLIKAGVSKKSIVRGGSRSKKPGFEEINLKENAKKLRYDESRMALDGVKKSIKKIIEQFEKISPRVFTIEGEKPDIPFEIIEMYLEEEGMNEHLDSFHGVRDDGFTESNFDPFEYWNKWTAGVMRIIPDVFTMPTLLQENWKTWEYTLEEREIFLSCIVNILREEFKESMDEYKQRSVEAQEIQQRAELEVLRSASIVGFTTTGAAKYRDLLQKLGAETIICEEAGEVLEPHVLAALSGKTKRLILIGDHLQLRPKVNLYQLEVDSGKGYDLDVSLFERLIGEEQAHEQETKGEGFGITTLHMQRRMRPEISSLFRECKLYPTLEDDTSVKNYPNVRGIKENVYFWDHNHKESGGTGALDGLSYQNKQEADMVVAIVQHLIKNGYSGGEQIAVLTPYLGQVKLLKDLLKETRIDVDVDEITKEDLIQADLESESDKESENEEKIWKSQAVTVEKHLLSCVRLSSVDNFQGEEADIVIISTVRSNDEGRAGFLKVMNRINVMLSRAKHGMYILGDSQLVEKAQKKSEDLENGQFFLFGEFLRLLKSRGLVNKYVPLRCDKHPTSDILASTPNDFRIFSPEGGCSESCGGRLDCGHPCPLPCHPGKCRGSVCSEICTRKRACSHPCKKPCGMDCGECDELVEIKVPTCGHMAKVQCKYASLDIKELTKLYETGVLKCFENVECSYNDDNRPSWGCKHTWESKCHEVKNMFDRPICTANCEGKCEGCNHECKRACKECSQHRKHSPTDQHAPCLQECGAILICGHICKSPCHKGQQCPSCNEPCASKCTHSKCTKPCSSDCSPCIMPCDWRCSCSNEYECTVPCGAPCDRLPCNNRCTKKLPCGHQCPSICGEDCPSELDYCIECIQEGRSSSKFKDDIIDLIALATLKQWDPNTEPIIVLECKHVFTMSSLDNATNIKDFYNCDKSDASANADGILKWSSLKPFENYESKFQMPICPHCRQPINIRRYGRIINATRLYLTTQQHKIRVENEITGIEKELQQYQVIRDILLNHFSNYPSAKDVESHMLSLKPRPRSLKVRITKLENEENNPILKINNAITTFLIRKKTKSEQLFPHPLDQIAYVKTLWTKARICMINAQISSMEMLSKCFEKIPRKGKSRKENSSQNSQSGFKKLEYKLNSAVSIEKDIVDAISSLEKAEFICVQTQSWKSHHETLLRLANIYLDYWGIVNFFESIHQGLFKLPKFDSKVKLFNKSKCIDEMGRYIKEAEKPSKVELKGDFLKYLNQLKESHKSLSKGLSKEEKTMVFLALVNEVGNGEGGYGGHWFQCPNGHVYAIGECGGAMEESRCIECNAKIGGSSHRLAQNNTRADGFLGEVSSSSLQSDI